jgi:cysteine sulfinate desulfinase/cysteine desulfurase-like protein
MANVDYNDAELHAMQGLRGLGVTSELRQNAQMMLRGKVESDLRKMVEATCQQAGIPVAVKVAKAKAQPEREMARELSRELCEAIYYLIADMEEYHRIHKLPTIVGNYAHRRTIAAVESAKSFWGVAR